MSNANPTALQVLDDLLWITARLEQVHVPDDVDEVKQQVAIIVADWRLVRTLWDSDEPVAHPAKFPPIDPDAALAYSDGTAVRQHLYQTPADGGRYGQRRVIGSHLNAPPHRRGESS